MGLFDFFKKPKNDIEQYLDEMKKREQTTTMGKKITNDISSGVDASFSNHYNKRIEENTLYSKVHLNEGQLNLSKVDIKFSGNSSTYPAYVRYYYNGN